LLKLLTTIKFELLRIILLIIGIISCTMTAPYILIIL